ncbi:beta strand repeat-containing protein, partial [Flavihumibacter petaseus]
ISSSVTPVFNAIGPLCLNSPAPTLPASSNNGINGTWSPAAVNTSVIGTTTYTFTPDAASCGVPTTIDITITDLVTPTFDPIGAICQNGVAPALPATSLNGVNGSWSPAVINTATIGTSTYTFTPAAGECAAPVSIDITISSSVTPVFTAIGPLCLNSPAPTLPGSSNNGINGTWSPATISTATVGTTTYTFTPDAASCGVPTTIDITITDLVTPTFDPIGAICQNAVAPALPSISLNGINGTWSPAVINTSVIGTSTYTFTPAAGECAAPVSIGIAISSSVTPVFTAIGPLCLNSVAPTLTGSSNNGINGTWSPATINTATVGTTTYTFTPDAASCGVTTTIDITISDLITPTFDPIGAICQNATAPALSSTSLNGVNGSWSPAVINTATIGTTTYTFTPAAGECAAPVSIDVTISTSVTPIFNAIGPLCLNSPAPVLPGTSNNSINGTWNPATVNTSVIGTTTYTFTPDATGCGVPTTIDITITDQVTPIFDPIAAFCAGVTAPLLPAASLNGITGTWSPAVVNNTTSGTYIFTPDAGQCAVPVSIDITVTPAVAPTFDPIAALCLNSTAPALPATSLNGINGTWLPAVINTSVIGTSTYTFTPAAGACAAPVSIDVTITDQITPTFTAIPAFCAGTPAPLLPATSINGITGSWVPAVVNNTTSGSYTFLPDAGQCAAPVSIDITVTPAVAPAFDAIGALCQNSAAPGLPSTSTNGINGTWSPAVINTSVIGTTTYNFTPAAGECATPVSIDVTISTSVTPVFNAIGPLCLNSPAPVLPGTSNNGINGTWSPAIVVTNTIGTTTYTFTPDAAGCGVPTTIDITIADQITPTFDPIAAFCTGATAPVLPAASLNGITGTWSPAVVNNTASGTYTFTPDAGQCAAPVSIDITVTPTVTPTFAAIPTFCAGTTAPVLPVSSLNGITGTWIPAIVSNTISGTYSFIPDAGQCAEPITIDITVTPVITPTFDPIAALCLNGTAPALPVISLNGINGTWSPAVINTSVTGNTTYTFTPAAGSCAAPISIDVTITDQITPTFTAIPAFCAGGVAPVLPTASLNGITGTWAPATVSNTTTGSYTFTPDAGQCAAPVTIDITVTPAVTPAFDAVGALCQNSVAPALPATSNNGINGTWSPAVINTSVIGTTTYTFTPAAGECATPVSIDVTIATSVTPVFNAIGPLCLNSPAPTLPATSNNGINGTWSPAIVATNVIGTTTYTFTPDAAGCGVPTTIDITITDQITPAFDPIAAFCAGATAPVLPVASLNGITGTWSPALVNNTTSGTYTFTPDAGQCAVPVNIDINVTPAVTPTFAAIPTFCEGSAAPVLPAASLNGITGTWSPALVNNTTSGTYTFTPDAGQCAAPVSIDITVSPAVAPTFDPIAALCLNSAAPALPAASLNGVGGTWSPAVINTSVIGTATYTFTPAAGECATPVTIDVTITDQLTPTFTAIPAFCAGSIAPVLPIASLNGITGTWVPAFVNNTTSGSYTFIPDAGQCAAPVSIDITVTPAVAPAFDAIGALCQNSAAPALPSTSTNGINGTWSPAAINTSVIGTTTYTFTPAAGECATPVSIDVTIATSVTPIFNAIGPLCLNSPAPALPGTSNNSISGTWSPTIVNTSVIGTTTYTFTPEATGCGVPTTIDITITDQIAPTFDPIAAFCAGATAPVLPAASLNGITGTWSPAVVSNSASGTYTFTPDAGQCAAPVSIDITVTPAITPTFAAIPAFCAGTTAPVLPVGSLNGITGTWIPAIISNTTSGTYSFIPDAGQCAEPVTIDITVTPAVTPTFDPIAALCLNSTAPALPATSLNGINGTWSPAVINTSTIGTSTYTFTPAAGECATPVSIDVTIADQITPTFTAIPAFCASTTSPILPVSSLNGITGTWAPATVSNTTSGSYTFTPDAGQCAAPVTIDITVTPAVTPAFDAIGAICQNSVAPALPATSNNGINGTWSPAAINTSVIGTTTYTFTPAAGECATL